MKKIAIAVLVLGISIAGVSRLHLRMPGDLRSTVPRAVVTGESSLALEAPIRPTITLAEIPQKKPRTVTVQVPRTIMEMRTVTRTEMVPVTRTEQVPVKRIEMVPETVVVEGDEPANVNLPLVPTFDRVGTVTEREVRVNGSTPAIEPGAVWPSPVRNPQRYSGPPRLARVDLEYVLGRMREFNREKQKLETELDKSKQTRRNARAEMLRLFQERINQEQNQVIKEALQSAMAAKNLEMSRENNDLIKGRLAQLRSQMIDKIVGEVARYANEKHILVVRRVDQSFSSRNEEVLYSAEAGGAQEVEITDEIADRLNRADSARIPVIQQGA
jgi:hypothetical protein